jgi:hypothetical protein
VGRLGILVNLGGAIRLWIVGWGKGGRFQHLMQPHKTSIYFSVRPPFSTAEEVLRTAHPAIFQINSFMFSQFAFLAVLLSGVKKSGESLQQSGV